MSSLSNERRLHPNQLLLPGLALGLVMVVIGVVLTGILRHKNLIQTWYPVEEIAVVWEIGIGLGLGILTAGVVGVLTNQLAHLGALREKIAAVIELRQVTVWHALAFGLLAGLPEEILFRGAVQPIIGLWLTALVFGLLHAISPTYALYAGLAGLGLGVLASWRGDLWAATAAHFAYDATLFMIMAWWAAD